MYVVLGFLFESEVTACGDNSDVALPFLNLCLVLNEKTQNTKKDEISWLLTPGLNKNGAVIKVIVYKILVDYF